MEFINKVEVCGMIGTIHTESISSTSKVTTLTVCVNEVYTDAKGNAAMETTWFKVSVWNSDEEFNVGDYVHIKGKFRMRKYIDSTNNERVTYDIVANEVHTLKVEPKMKRFKVKLCLFNNPSINKEVEVMAEDAILAGNVAAQNERDKDQQEWYAYEAELIK